MDAVANVLNAFGRIARDDAAFLLVVESKRGNAVVLAVKNSSLAIRRGGRQSAEPPPEPKVVLGQEPLNRRTVSEAQRAPQIGVGERIDLQHQEPAPSV